MPNLLASEKSPYLLQHASNPVNWYPWGEAAFAKARAESKPIFLSVGYSTCHWCHVMAHESFENDAIARVLNERFVAVKVDREERPDVDRVYMLFVQATTGGGGWPMSVWLTPELQPFYGGTYFPPTSRWGRPGFLEVLDEIARLWRTDPEQLRRSAANVTEQMQRLTAPPAQAGTSSGAPGEEVLERAVGDFRASFDSRYGGFGGAPKFPRPSELFFLLREFARRGDQSARDMALATLRGMARGGMHDHLGGGFHRYSVDERWHVPHFEKMLYDQAQLALSYLEAWQVTREPEFAQVATGILGYVARDLGRPDGGFYSAEDADSLPADAAGKPGARPTEGAFYAWTDAEFSRVAGADAEVAAMCFGVRQDGNVASDPHGEFTGQNVLYLAKSVDEVAKTVGRPRDEVAERLDGATGRLFQARARRPRPGRDDKIIVAWNGLMIAAFARASRAGISGAAERSEGRTVRGSDGEIFGPSDLRTFGPSRWLQTARDAASFIESAMWDSSHSRLLRRYRDGEAAIDAYADDYACLVFGLLELFQADGDARWLDWAVTLQRRQDELFEDGAGGGWFGTSGRDGSVLLRLKEDYDGAEPAASSVAAWNLLTLSRVTGEGEWTTRAERAFGAFRAQMAQTPRAMPMMLAALEMWHAPGQEIVILGAADGDDTARLKQALAARYLPFAVTLPLDPAGQEAVARRVPFVAAMTMREGRATAYVCRDFACRQPTTDPAAMLEQLP